MILLKVDLAKAFDTVAWPFLLEVLEHFGFLLCWRDWISAMLSIASTRVLTNGRAGRRICHACGLRQGDPLSPFLFIIIMEVLNVLITEADRPPLSLDFSYIHMILELFAGASGLATNLDKCAITPIRCSEEDVVAVRQVFPCRLQEFPTTYLGAPLSLSKLP
ncbi:secreted RxLR effector protein 78-like [Miscanthus floridulus]|uniref:secreted RxLR effector protein 78-like n=1 Tax=Miscanthus floridulus TaxID=154761 RepID=UPI00345A8462